MRARLFGIGVSGSSVAVLLPIRQRLVGGRKDFVSGERDCVRLS